MTSETEKVAAVPDAPIGGRTKARASLSAEQKGLMVAALVAFLGIAYVGPAVARLRRRPTLKERLDRRARAARLKVRKAGSRLRKRVHQLGGGRTNWG